MPPQIALLLCIFFILYLFKMDSRRKSSGSPALWIPLIWMMIIGSKPISSWLNPGAGYVSPDELLAGSPIDRNIFILLIVAGLFILSRRKIDWAQIFKSNSWIFLFFLYCGISILWSDFPFVSFKRWIKTVGNLVMVLIVLTEPNPVESIKALIRRCAYVLISLSIVLIKYYLHLGRYYDQWTGAVHYSGISYNKNGLGYLCLVSGIFFFWNLLTMWRKNISADKKELFVNILFLIMTLWLLIKANSATSLGCLIIGICILIGLSIIKNNVRYLGVYIFSAVFIFMFLYLSFDLYEIATSSLGRDTTLTERTYLWKELIDINTNPLIGTGYESFWLGDRLEKLWAEYPWRPNQAHNGYIDIYLNLGLIGLFLLTGIMVSVYRKIRMTLLSGFDYGRFRMAFLVMVLLYNVTEAAFKGLHLIFFIFLLIAVNVPQLSQLK